MKDASGSFTKAEYWRSYTASLLFQAPEAEETRNWVVSQHMPILLGYLAAFQESRTPSNAQPTAKQVKSLESYIYTAVKTAQQLRCQRGCYEVDRQMTKLGSQFNGSSMINLDHENVSEAGIVCCIISKGIIRRPFSESPKVDGQISKARVYVTGAENSKNLVSSKEKACVLVEASVQEPPAVDGLVPDGRMDVDEPEPTQHQL